MHRMTATFATLVVLFSAPAFAEGSLRAFASAPATHFPSISATGQLMGEPLSTGIREVPNQHERNIPNVEATLSWPGMTATFVVAICCEKTLLRQVVVTDLDQLKRFSINVPRSRSAAIDRFGPPSRADASKVAFEVPTEVGANEVVLRYEDRVLTAVVWNYFID